MLPAAQQVSVAKGQFLGNVGNSGSSSAPHLHIHAEKGGKPAVMRFEQGLSKRFVEKNTQIQGGWNGSGSGQTWAGIFEPGTYGPMALFKDNWNDFLSSWQAIEKQSYRMMDFEAYPSGRRMMYVGIFEPGSYEPAAVFTANDWSGFLERWQQLE